MKSDDKLPPIAVTIPKTGFTPDPGCTPCKYHPYFSSKVGDVYLDMLSHISCSNVDPGSPVREAEWSVANTPDHQQPQVSASTFTPNSEVAARRGCQSHTTSSPFPTPSPGSELHSISQTTNICFDVLNMTSLEIFAADLHGHGRRETFNPVRQKLMSAPPPQTKSGQSGAEPLTGLRTPSKSTEGIFLNSTPQEGSVFVDGKRRSARSNYSYTADGTPAADEYVLDKAKRRAAIRNLDSYIAASLRGSNIASSPGNPSFISPIDIQKDTCIANLNSIGISLGSTSKAINVSYNALKRIKVDRVTVQPNLKGTGRALFDFNPFELSDEEDHENDCGLLSHLVKEVTDVDLDDLDLATKICDLKESGRKSKSS